MKDLNQVILEGRLTKDSEVRKTGTGKTVQRFSIAVNDDYKPKDSDEWVNRAYFINCVYFGELDGLTKGVHVLINGKLITTKSETEDGVKIYTKVEVQGLRFVKDKDKAEKVEEKAEKKVEEDTEEVPF